MLDLHEGILEEFAGWSHDHVREAARADGVFISRDCDREIRLLQHRRYYTEVRTLPAVRAKENQANSVRRGAARAARAAERSPCPHCGAKVERVGRSAKIPMYCTSKCMRAATWARWYARHRRSRKAGS